MNLKKIHILFIVFIVAISTLFVNGDNISAKSKKNVEKEIMELEKDEEGLTNKKNEIDSEKGAVESEMDENLSEQESVQAELDEVDGKLASTEANIKMKEIEIGELEKEVKQLQTDIKELDEEIVELKEKIQVRSDLLKDRLRSIQENGGLVQYVSVILGSETFADLITRSSTVNVIMDQDKNIMEALAADQLALQEKQLEVKTKKTEVEDKKKDQEKQKTRLQSMKVTLDEQKDKQAKIKSKLAEAFEELEEHNLSLDEESQIISDQAAALDKAKNLAEENLSEIKRNEEAERKEAERKAAAERKANQAESSGSSGSSGNSGSSGSSGSSGNSGSGSSDISVGGNGSFAWPVHKRDIKRISSEFQPNRVHPIFGYARPHNGMDLAVSHGKPVLSAQTGVVSTTKRSSRGLGNHITVTHFVNGQAYATIYGHLSSINVSPGQVVNIGQEIGKIGTTGDSTGPHLHFEVHPGGYKNPANPRNYLP